MILTVLACLLVVECRDASPFHLFASPTSSLHHLFLRMFHVRPSSGNAILRHINLCRPCRSAAKAIPAAVCFCHSLAFVVVVCWTCKVEVYFGDVGGRKADRLRGRALLSLYW